jgi:hypothetical protein
LNAEIASLEEQIKRLEEKSRKSDSRGRLRSTALPGGLQIPAPQTRAEEAPRKNADPIFEPVDKERLDATAASVTTPQHFNELGVRKYDLPALLRRMQNHFRGPPASNPKLVSYLAAGGIQGLRPLRYEKRVARNRFIALFIFFFAMLLGIIIVYRQHR